MTATIGVGFETAIECCYSLGLFAGKREGFRDDDILVLETAEDWPSGFWRTGAAHCSRRPQNNRADQEPVGEKSFYTESQ